MARSDQARVAGRPAPPAIANPAQAHRVGQVPEIATNGTASATKAALPVPPAGIAVSTVIDWLKSPAAADPAEGPAGT